MGWTIRGLIPGWGKRLFSSSSKAQSSSDVHSPTYSGGTRFFFFKWLRCEADHSLSFNAKDNKIGKVRKAQLYWPVRVARQPMNTGCLGDPGSKGNHGNQKIDVNVSKHGNKSNNSKRRTFGNLGNKGNHSDGSNNM